MEHPPYEEYRCACNRLLFRATPVFTRIEVKCKRCSVLTCFDAQSPKVLAEIDLHDQCALFDLLETLQKENKAPITLKFSRLEDDGRLRGYSIEN